MKAFAVALTLTLLVSVAAGALLINLALANYIPYPPEPNEDPPTLIVQTPQNSTTYNVNTVNLTFTVTKPDSWLYNGLPYYYEGFIGMRVAIIGQYHIRIYLDGNYYWDYSDRLEENLTTNYSLVLYGLTKGGHSVIIDLEATTYYNPYYPNHTSAARSKRLDNVSDTIHFTVNTPEPFPNTSEPFPTAIVAAASGASVAIIGIGLLIYFRKRNHAKISKHSETEQSST